MQDRVMVLAHCTSPHTDLSTNRQTDRRMDRRTDGQTDRQSGDYMLSLWGAQKYARAARTIPLLLFVPFK